MHWQVQECRTKPSIIGRKAAAVVSSGVIVSEN
jgi:hypothetical protein